MWADTGARCDRHTGEPFPPRCYDCGNLNEIPRDVIDDRPNYVLCRHRPAKFDRAGYCLYCGGLEHTHPLHPEVVSA